MTGSMSRRLSPEERRLWSRVARTVRLAPGRRVEPEDDGTEPSPSGGPLASPGAGAGAKQNRSARRAGPPEDLSGQRRIRRGQSGIDARLDLHGHTQDTAQRELIEFILRHSAAGARCVLVITGKGRLGTGILRARLFDWISDPDLRPWIAGYAKAHPRHGGEGAVYLFLRSGPP
jgi:DNA-nicking Smr family endonuclease